MNNKVIDALSPDNKVRIKKSVEILLHELEFLKENKSRTYTIPFTLFEKEGLDKQVVFNIIDFINENCFSITNVSKLIAEEVEKVIDRPMYLPSMSQDEILKKKADATYATIKRFTYKRFLLVEDYYQSYILEIPNRAGLSIIYEYLLTLPELSLLDKNHKVVASYETLKLTGDGKLFENDQLRGV